MPLAQGLDPERRTPFGTGYGFGDSRQVAGHPRGGPCTASAELFLSENDVDNWSGDALDVGRGDTLRSRS